MYYLLYSVFLGTIMGLWMYADAKKQKLENPSVWIWIGAMFSFFGLLTYYFWHVRPKKGNTKDLSKGTKALVYILLMPFSLLLFLGLKLYFVDSQASIGPEGLGGLAGLFGFFVLFIDFFLLLLIIWVIDKNRHRKNP
jgi:hypothetical protein